MDVDDHDYILPDVIKTNDEIQITKTEIESSEKDLDEKSKYIRGLREKRKTGSQFGQHYQFVSYKFLLACKKKYENQFIINIPDPEFTKEDYEKFVFPKPIFQMEVVPEKLSEFKPEPGTTVCIVCDERYPNTAKLRLHVVKSHNIHYRCPFENCGHVKQNLKSESTKFEFARHLHLHEHEHPQLSQPHECLGCDFQTPFIRNAVEHIDQWGPFHNNKCPKCPLRFTSRKDLADHITISNHIGYCCGLCEEVFDTISLRMKHRRKMHVQSLGKAI